MNAKRVIAMTGALVVGSCLAGSIKTWNGGSGNWNTPSNWSGNAVPVSGDGVVLTSSAGAAEIVNDIPGLSLVLLKYTGDNPIRLSGQAVTLDGGANLQCNASVAVTNAVELVLASGAHDFSLGQNSEIVFAGAITGAGKVQCKRMDYAGTPKYRFCVTNTYAGGTYLAQGQYYFHCGHSFGNASDVETTGGIRLAFPAANVIEDYDFRQTSGGQFYFLYHGAGCAIGSYANELPGDVAAYFRGMKESCDADVPSYGETQEDRGVFTIRRQFASPKGSLNMTGLRKGCTIHFGGDVTADTIVPDRDGNCGNDCGWFEFGDVNLVLGVWVNMGWHCLRMGKANQYPAKHPLFFSGYCESHDYCGKFDLNGFDQCFAGVANGWTPHGRAKEGRRIYSAKPATLTLTPTEARLSDEMLDGAVSVIVNASGKAVVQEFKDRRHLTTGTLAVQKGVLKVSGEATFENVPAVTVGAEGSLDLQAASDAQPFPAGLLLRLDEAGQVTIPDGADYTVGNVYVAGNRLAAGVYTGKDGTTGTPLAQVSGKGILRVTRAPLTCVWTGAAGNGKWSEAANWENGEVPSTGDDVRLAGAANAEYVNDIDGLTLTTLTLTGANAFSLSGKALTVTSVMGEDLTGAVTIGNDLITGGQKLTVGTDGGTLTVGGTVSGAGRLVLTGAGVKCLRGANAQAGGFELAAGSLKLENAAAAGPVGSTIVISGGRLWFACADATFAYDVVPTGTCDIRALENGTLSGVVTNDNLAATVRIGVSGLDVDRGRLDNVEFRFADKVSLARATVMQYVSEKSAIHFDAGLVCAKLSGGDGDTTYGSGPFCFAKTEASDCPLYNLMYGYVICEAAHALPTNCVINWAGWCSGRMAYIDMRDYDQTLDRLSCGYWNNGEAYRKDGRFITSTSPVSLFLRGTASAVTHGKIDGQVTVVWDAADKAFVQEFTNASYRVSTTTGGLIASNGVLRLGAGANFPNVTYLEAAPDGKVEILTAVPGALASVAAISVAEDGEVSIADAAVGMLDGATARFDLSLETGAVLRIPSGMTLRVGTLTVDGEVKEGGSYDASRLPQIVGGGKLDVEEREVPTVAATWCGGAETDSALEADNWGGETPDLFNMSLLATFASGGSRAEIPAGARFKGLAFSGAVGEFEVAAGVSGDLSLGKLGIDVSANHQAAISVPLTAVGRQVWQVGDRSRLSVGDVTPGEMAFPIVKTGAGRLDLTGEILSDADFIVSNGMVNVWSATNALGVASSAGGVWVDQSAGASLMFQADSVVERPVTVRCSGKVGGLIIGTNTTVVFTAPVVSKVKDPQYNFCNGSKTVFAGGFDNTDGSGWATYDGANAEFEVINVPAKFYYLYMDWAPEMHFKVSGNSTTMLNFQHWGRLYLEAENAFVNGSGYPAVKIGTVAGGAAEKNMIDLCGFNQRFGTFTLNPNAALVTSSRGPAVMTFEPVATTNTTMLLTGGAGLKKLGASLFAINRELSSTGTLEVAEGTMSFLANGTWRKCPQVTVSGSGRLELTTSRVFGRKMALDLAGNGTVELAEGVVQRCSTLAFDGVAQDNGTWGGPESSADHKSAKFSGKGEVLVGPLGGAIIIR